MCTPVDVKYGMALWKTSPSVSSMARANSMPAATLFACVSSTPFGRPVVPDVYRMSATSCSDTSALSLGARVAISSDRPAVTSRTRACVESLAARARPRWSPLEQMRERPAWPTMYSISGSASRVPSGTATPPDHWTAQCNTSASNPDALSRWIPTDAPGPAPAPASRAALRATTSVSASPPRCTVPPADEDALSAGWVRRSATASKSSTIVRHGASAGSATRLILRRVRTSRGCRRHPRSAPPAIG